MSLETASATLGGVCILQSLASMHATSNTDAKANAIGATVCFIAYAHYQWMLLSKDSNNDSINLLRYSDWFITLPLLYYETTLLCGINDNTVVIPSVLLLLGMLLFGRLSINSQTRYKGILLVLGFLCLIACLVLFILNTPDITTSTNSMVVLGCMCTWFLYGILAYWHTSTVSSIGFNILDIINKALLGIFVAISTLSSEST